MINTNDNNRSYEIGKAKQQKIDSKRQFLVVPSDL